MLGWEFPPQISGGLGTACQGLAQGLDACGVEVTFVVPRAQGSESAGGARVLGASAFSSEVARGPRTLALDSALRPYQSAREYRDERAAGAGERGADLRGGYGAELAEEVQRYAELVGAIARREPFDLVHAHDWMAYPAGLLAKEQSGKPLVNHLHACEHDRNAAHPDARILELEQAGFSGADRVLCVSHYAAGVLGRHYRLEPQRLRVVHNAVEQPHLASGPRAARGLAEPVVLFVGRITAQKGPEHFLEAAARVVAEEPRVKFLMCGAGDLYGPAIELAARRGLARHVHFTGFLGREEIERAYALADVYVMPSVSEPFGIAPLEAAARELPVIVSRQSGVAEVLRSALVVDPGDAHELAQAILALLRYPELARELARAARAEALRLRWTRQAELVREVYEELVA
jgi:glycogen(starch) synthase